MPGISLSDLLLIHTKYRLPANAALAQTIVVLSRHYGVENLRASNRFVHVIAQKRVAEAQAHVTSLACRTLHFAALYAAPISHY